MGVPALFRWLSKKYPKIVQPVIEAPLKRVEVEGGYEEIPTDTSAANPNGMEFDNLYLDMNGIVHPCTHPEGKKAPETEEDMMIEVFKYTDRVVSMIRPRKLLMIAIDGVAPRAKMNQQRSRRFRAAQEAATKAEEREIAITEWKAMGKELSEDFMNEKAWDSNAITPGTPFMTLLANSLRYWIAYKMNHDPGWKDIQVILSDASVPGEGEHKIMDFIRRQRTQPEYDANTRHVIYGLDADLIMLSLATHEPHFKVLREDVFFQEKKARGCHRCGQPGHHSSQCTGKPKEKQGEFDEKGTPVDRKPFIFLDVSTLREYLEIELDIPNVPFAFDFERAIDDWVLLIFFVGNDFLPHLPSLEIREGAIDTLLSIWKNQLSKMGGYMTDCGKLDLRRAGIILEGLASREDDIFRRRREAEERQDRAEKRRRIERGQDKDEKPPRGGMQDVNASYVEVRSSGGSNSSGPSNLPPRPNSLPPRPDFLPARPGQTDGTEGEAAPTKDVSMMSNADVIKNRAAIRTANLSAAAMLKAELAGKLELPEKPAETEVAMNGTAEDSTHDASGMIPAEVNAVLAKGTKRKADEAELEKSPIDQADIPDPLNEEIEDPDAEKSSSSEEDEAEANMSVSQPGPAKPPPMKMLGNNMVEQEDMVKLYEPGYRERYYRQKFGLELSDGEARRKIVEHYVEGLCWVLGYYYQGCQSWSWYYPYHYAPFATDFTNLDKFDIKFDLNAPARPYEQLMGVFPAASRSHIPSTYHSLMTDFDSPIIDFYPSEFEIDMNGKKMLWQGVALLPFIERDRLLAAMKEREGGLSEAERNRNAPGHAVIFLNEDHPQYDLVSQMYAKKGEKTPTKLSAKTARGVFGSITTDPDCVPGTTFGSPLPETGLPDIYNDRSVSARYEFPSQRVPHRSVLLKGVKQENRVLTSADRDIIRRGGSFQPSHGEGFHQQRRDMGGPGISGPRRDDYRNGGPPKRDYGPSQGGYGGGRDPYGGYGYGGGGPPQGRPYGGGPPGGYNAPRPPPPSYGGAPSPYGMQQAPYGQQQYGGYGAPPPPSYGGGYHPPPQQYGAAQGGGYRPPPIQPQYTRPLPPPPVQQRPYGAPQQYPNQGYGQNGQGYMPNNGSHSRF